MNRLESAVRAVMHSLGIDQLSAAATRCGLTISQLSKILRGDIGLSPENLRKLVTGLSSEPHHQFQILSAHLYDESERSDFDLSLLKIVFAGSLETPVTISDLPEGLQRELRTIGDRVKDGDKDLGGTVSWLAAAINGMPAEQLDEGLMAAEDSAKPGEGLTPAEQLAAVEAAKRRKRVPYPKHGKY